MYRIFLFLFLLFGVGFQGFAADEVELYNDVENSTVMSVGGYMPYVAKKDEVIYSSSNYKINKVDPTFKTNAEGVNMPGARGTNQLIIYTPESGKTTGTNEYGYEAIVVGNTVVDLSGANSPIPENGFVISGHGKAKTWINNSVKIGTKVFVDLENMTLYTYVTSESYLFLAGKKLEETEQMIQYYAQNNPNFNQKFSNVYIEDAKKYIKKAKKNPQAVRRNVSLSIEASNDALKSIIPYKPSEMKGVWIRPTEKSAYEVRNTVKRLKKMGINAVFLETFYHGKTIYPSRLMSSYGFVPQNELFVGFDPLAVWREECKKEKIKLHIWFETFYLGNDNPNVNPQSILFLHPAWSNKNKKDYASINPTKVTTEHNGYFLDPVNPEVRNFIADLIEEIIVTYRPDGINLDYIRYPQAVSEMNSWGYTEIARRLFREQYGIDPIDVSANEDVVAWANFRRSYVTAMVKLVGNICKKNKTYFSVVIFPDRLMALTTKLQDWKEWSLNGYVDGVTPLFLTCDARTASASIRRVLITLCPKTDVFAGLFVTFIGGSADDLIRQLHEARKINLKGVVLFDYAHITNKYTNVLAMFFHPREAENVSNRVERSSETLEQTLKETKKNKRNWFFSFD